MRSFVDSILNTIREFFKKLSRKEIIRLVILAAVIIGLGITVATILGRTTYVTLHSGLSSEDAGRMFATLQEWGEDVKLEGTTVLVPEGREDELRARLSAEGFQTGNFDYGLYGDNATGFGSTDYEKQIYSTLMLESHIMTLLNKMSKVRSSLVKLSLPQNTPFVLSRSKEEARATVQVELVSGASLSQAEVDAIADTVINAVPGLAYERMSITDTNMKTYSAGGAEQLDGNISADAQIELERQVETSMERQVENLLSAVFGLGSVKAMVHATLNFDDIVSEEIEFAPPVAGEDGGIAVTMHELYEAQRTDGEAQGIPGTDSNGMGAIEYPWGTLDENGVYEKYEREINYEINKTTTQIKQAKGKMTDLSISVLINRDAVAEDFTPSVINLVANAIGVDEGRISVENLPFPATGNTDLDNWKAIMDSIANKELLKTIITWGMVALLVAAVMLFIRSILKSARPPEPVVAAVGAGPGEHVDYMASEEIYSTVPAPEPLPEIDLNAKPENVANLEKFIEKDPAAVAQLLRNWLSDD